MESFRDETARLRKGIRVAWAVNFILIWLVFCAVGVVFALGTHISNAQLVEGLIVIGIIAALVALIVMALVSAQASRIMLAVPQGDAVKVTNGQLFNVVEEMAIAASLPSMPDVYVLRGSGVQNAYAVADTKGHTQVVVTTELLDLLQTREQLQGVIGHEIGHLSTGDSPAMTKLIALTSTTAVIASLASRFMFFGGGGGRDRENRNQGSNIFAVVIIVVSYIFLLIAPLLSKIAESYMSRERESRADAKSVEFTRNPTALAQALILLDGGTVDQKSAKQFANSVGPVAFFNPARLNVLLSTHPPTTDRVKRLVEMGAQI